MKGLEVVSCSWKNPEAAAAQVRDMLRFRDSSTAQAKQHLQGVVQTIWSGVRWDAIWQYLRRTQGCPASRGLPSGG